MALSRTIALVAVVVFMVCAILASTPEAARMGRQRGEFAVAGVAGVDGGGNVRYWEQRRGLVGRRPRLASFTRRDGVAGGEDGGSKREVPSGPDPIHHGGVAPSSSAEPTTP
ncbi:unnamed protein product [Urochloa decumbens]|uniref:Uncharacterized protein n=1 Tax=Urochloa decumbens TaxID=240449 RepID=A0ABC9E1E9_9POAL